jgi:hypothetical protein
MCVLQSFYAIYLYRIDILTMETTCDGCDNNNFQPAAPTLCVARIRRVSLFGLVFTP